jgi:hypothetical protein
MRRLLTKESIMSITTMVTLGNMGNDRLHTLSAGSFNSV